VWAHLIRWSCSIGFGDRFGLFSGERQEYKALNVLTVIDKMDKTVFGDKQPRFRKRMTSSRSSSTQAISGFSGYMRRRLLSFFAWKQIGFTTTRFNQLILFFSYRSYAASWCRGSVANGTGRLLVL
jgi:hypothetical protein